MKQILISSIGITLGIIFLGQTLLSAYPFDGYDHTGIRRLKRLELIMAREIPGPGILPGAGLNMASVRLAPGIKNLNLSDARSFLDPALQQKIDALFPNRDESYSIAVLDITPGRGPRLAMNQPDRRFPVGSVGKLAVAAGLFAELQHLFPDSTEKRLALLKNRMIAAGPWVETDHHAIPFFIPETRVFFSRPAQQGDLFSLYEWADHMMSASANSAASTVWKELVLMRHFKELYPPSKEAEDSFFATAPKQMLTNLAEAVVNEPLTQIKISKEEFHLGNLFTSQGKNRIPGTGNSLASPFGLLKYLVALEQGKVVDEWSSLEIKRLMYMTARRIRYASSPALNKAAVYFKSGSLYRCRPEPGFTCRKYMGNQDNIMNSVAIVEHPDSRIYMVALMTNVLKKNSAMDHQTLATEIEALLQHP